MGQRESVQRETGADTQRESDRLCKGRPRQRLEVVKRGSWAETSGQRARGRERSRSEIECNKNKKQTDGKSEGIRKVAGKERQEETKESL